MAEPFNPAMQGYGNQQPIMGTPRPMFNSLGTGNPQIDLAFAQFGMPMLQQFMGGAFIPEQFPAQSVMDQMASSKYMQASRTAEQSARDRGTGIMFQQFKGIRNKFDNSPLSQMGAAQLNNLAGTVNSQFGMMMSEMLIGPQASEDLFFGRRGDPVQLQRAVNQVGFSRSDSVNGTDSMSGESLTEFSDALYGNLYGPDADLNDVSGFSAGRVGGMMTDLSRRGLLPQSVSKMGDSARQKELAGAAADSDVGKTIGGFSKEIQDAIANNSPLEDIEKLTGGSQAIRKIDATRVASSLKGYTEAVASVRQIFGDNGISNAPMGQLMAAMEALTQNSMTTMSPGKIENLMRRTQLASRDSGVSLEALMGLSARGGALAQQYGLTPEMAAQNSISAMEQGRAMRDTGAFTPGFGRIDADKAVLAALDSGMRGDASMTGKYLGAMARAVAEDPNLKNSEAAEMVAALERGETTYNNGTDTVNIMEEFARRPGEFFGRLREQAGLSASHFDSLVRDPNSQEYLIPLAGAVAGAQGAEYKKYIENNFAGNADLLQRIKDPNMSEEQRLNLMQTMGSGFSRAVIDDVNTTMTGEERVDTLYTAMRSSMMDYVKENRKDLTDPADIVTEANRLLIGREGMFANEAEARNYAAQQYAETGTFVQGEFNISLPEMQQRLNARTAAASSGRRRRNITRAGLEFNLDDGSNMLQRFSDMLGSDSSASALEQVLGSIDSVKQTKEVMTGLAENDPRLETAFADLRGQYAGATINTEEEKADFAAEVTEGKIGMDEFKKRFAGTGENFEGKDKFVSDDALVTRMATIAKDGTTTDAFKQMYSTITGVSAAGAAAVFQDVNSEEAQAAFKRLAAHKDLQGESDRRGLGIVQAGELTNANAIEAINRSDAWHAGIDDQDKKRIGAIGKLGRQMDEGNINASTLLESYGVDLAGKTKSTEALTNFITNSGNIDEVKAALTDDNVDAAQAEKIAVMAQFSHNVNSMGGFSRMGAGSFASQAASSGRLTALTRAVDEGKVGGDLAAAVTAQKEGKTLTKEQQQLLDETTASPEAFTENVTKDVVLNEEKGVTSRENTAADIAKNAATEEQKINSAAGSLSGASGALGELTAGLTAAVGNLFKDVKIENITVTNFKLPDGFGKELASGAVSAISELLTGGLGGTKDVATTTASAGTKPSREPITITGSIRIKDMDTALVDFMSDTPHEPTTPGSPPVAVPA